MPSVIRPACNLSVTASRLPRSLASSGITWFKPVTRFEHGAVVPFRREARMKTISGRRGMENQGGQCLIGINRFNPPDEAVKVISGKKRKNLREKWQRFPAS